MDVEDASESITEMERHDRNALMSELPSEFAAEILQAMSPDDAADILKDLDTDVRSRIFRRLEREDAAEGRVQQGQAGAGPGHPGLLEGGGHRRGDLCADFSNQNSMRSWRRPDG